MFSAKGRKLVYVGENTTMVTLTSYFMQPCPCQFLLNCKRKSHQIQQETSQKFDRRRYYLDYSTKFQQFCSCVKYYTFLHDVAGKQSPLSGLFAHANFSNMKDGNDSAHIILKATMMLERNLFSKGIHDDDGNKNATRQCLFKEQKLQHCKWITRFFRYRLQRWNFLMRRFML